MNVYSSKDMMFRIVFWDVLPCKMIWHVSTSQKTILNIILAAVRTGNLTQ
jgi:hypothetical protein